VQALTSGDVDAVRPSRPGAIRESVTRSVTHDVRHRLIETAPMCGLEVAIKCISKARLKAASEFSHRIDGQDA